VANAQRYLHFVREAVDLLVQPHDGPKAVPSSAATFVGNLRQITEGNRCKLDAAVHQQLVGAWRRLQRSGVLAEGEGSFNRSFLEQQARAVEAARAARVEEYASAVLRTCALEACAAREVHAAQFKKCAGCQATVYCCKQHQVDHWPAHKAACKAARKAAAQGGAGPSSA
jgi:hypothetical protein